MVATKHDRLREMDILFDHGANPNTANPYAPPFSFSPLSTRFIIHTSTSRDAALLSIQSQSLLLLSTIHHPSSATRELVEMMPSPNLIIPFTFPFTLSLDSVHRGARWRGVNVGGVRPRSPAITSCSRDRRLVSFRFRSAHFSAGSSLNHAPFHFTSRHASQQHGASSAP
jgi:hypothetical protein